MVVSDHGTWNVCRTRTTKQTWKGRFNDQKKRVVGQDGCVFTHTNPRVSLRKWPACCEANHIPAPCGRAPTLLRSRCSSLCPHWPVHLAAAQAGATKPVARYEAGDDSMSEENI